MQPFLGPSICIAGTKQKNQIPYHLRSYLGVTHASCSNEGLLDGVALLKHSLLLAGHCPVALNQELDNLQVTSEGSVDQSTLPVLVQVIHLRGGDREICVNEDLWLHSQPVTSALPRSGLLRFIFSRSLSQSQKI